MNDYDNTIREIRRFNRFYTVNMGLLDSGYLDTEYSVAEIRILFEIKSGEKCIQSDIVKTLHIDKSYLSRIINGFYKSGLIDKVKSDKDKRISYIVLTEKGRSETERLIELTNNRIYAQISRLSPEKCSKLREAMNTVIDVLEEEG